MTPLPKPGYLSHQSPPRRTSPDDASPVVSLCSHGSLSCVTYCPNGTKVTGCLPATCPLPHCELLGTKAPSKFGVLRGKYLSMLMDVPRAWMLGFQVGLEGEWNNTKERRTLANVALGALIVSLCPSPAPRSMAAGTCLALGVY